MNDEGSLPVGTLDTLRTTLEAARRVGEVQKDQRKLISYFFRQALYPYYDCLWDGMRGEMGHAIYNLSEHVPLELRQSIEVYPSDEGTFFDADGSRWDSLEDWRKCWREHYPEGIPEAGETLTSLFLEAVNGA